MLDRTTRPALDLYNPLSESRCDELKIIYSSNGKPFYKSTENTLHCRGTQSTLPVAETCDVMELAVRVTLLNRGRAKSEGFPLNRLSVVLGSLHGKSSRLVKVGIFPRRERVGRFGRISGWQWVETGVILLDSKIMFVKGDLMPPKALMISIDAANRGDSEAKGISLSSLWGAKLFSTWLGVLPFAILRSRVPHHGTHYVSSLNTANRKFYPFPMKTPSITGSI